MLHLAVAEVALRVEFLGQRQPRAADRSGNGFKQHAQAPTVDAGQQRRDATL
jgi:hypothetical protein